MIVMFVGIGDVKMRIDGRSKYRAMTGGAKICADDATRQVRGWGVLGVDGCGW